MARVAVRGTPNTPEGAPRLRTEEPKTPKTRTPTAKEPRTPRTPATPVETPGTQVAAPPTFGEQFRKTLANTNITDQSGVTTHLPVPLEQIGQDFGPFVDRLKELIQERTKGMSTADLGGYFYQGFQEYPEAMARLVVRAALNNRVRAQGDVAKWMELVNARLAGDVENGTMARLQERGWLEPDWSSAEEARKLEERYGPLPG